MNNIEEVVMNITNGWGVNLEDIEEDGTKEEVVGLLETMEDNVTSALAEIEEHFENLEINAVDEEE